MDSAIYPGNQAQIHRDEKTKFRNIIAHFRSAESFFKSARETFVTPGILEDFESIRKIGRNSTESLDPSCFTSYICNPSAGRRRRPAFRADVAGARGHQHNGNLYACFTRTVAENLSEASSARMITPLSIVGAQFIAPFPDPMSFFEGRDQSRPYKAE